MSSKLLRVYIGSSGELTCEVSTPKGRPMELSGRATDIEPRVKGDDRLGNNEALISNAWSAAKCFQLVEEATDDDVKGECQNEFEKHRKEAENIASLLDDLTDFTKDGWCSGCFEYTAHRKVDRSSASLPVYLCSYCGSPTLGCAAPGCAHMATSGYRGVRIPKYCAEHRHEIPSFEKAADRVPSLNEYRDLLKFEKSNLSKGSKLAVAGVVTAGVIGSGAWVAAPSIGGAVGTLMGYSGAVASNAGLAMLGGGAVATGGLGMLGGTAVVAAMSAALGAGLGAHVTSAYVSEDKSFVIEQIIVGAGGPPVIIARGLNTEKDPKWHSAVKAARNRYPTSPVFIVTWGSKELKDFGAFFVNNFGKQQVMKAVGVRAARASVLGAKKLLPVAPVLLAASLAKNPWHTAKVRADKTGVALAGILARTEVKEYILIGHSLGARVMVNAAETLTTDKAAPKIQTIHLLGAAVGRNRRWRSLSTGVATSVHNYYSSNDPVLKYLYSVAMAGSVAIGRKGIGASYEKLVDHDVSDVVGGHSEYFEKVTLA